MRTYISFLVIFLLFNTMLNGQSWVSVADIPTGRHHPVTFALNGKGYSVTGTISSGYVTKTFYEYDPVLDTWTTLTDFPGDARGYSIGVVSNGFAYMGFGSSINQYLNDLWRYDAQNDQWTQMASCPCSGRTHPAMIANNGKIYVGLGNDGQNLNDWWEYTISSDSWIQMANLPGPVRHHPYQFATGGQVFAGLGHGNGIFDDWYRLDTTSNSWTAMANFPGEARVAGTQFDHGNYGYILSGDGDNHSFMPTGEMWQYDPLTDTWQQLTPHPGVSRWAPGSFVIGNDVYFFGGKNRQANTYPVSVDKFTLPSISVGISEDNHSDINVFPNPFSNQLSIKTEHTGHLQYRIWSVDGKAIQQGFIVNEYINTANIPDGIFILEIQESDENIIARKRLVKINE
ncbi:MAG: T9SS type A sorting domain-containing protein [Bacteroidia bacterium]|nr:T9SS type A sorting domain-containing protein [Bacteroidia bacterium]NNC85868.1 T9SS type A sorting domain-containing protein [Bacteroidia bacterium]